MYNNTHSNVIVNAASNISYKSLLEAAVFAVLESLTNIVIGKLGKFVHKQNNSRDIFYFFIYINKTSLLYKSNTLLLKQKKLPVLEITGFFFSIRTQVKAKIWILGWKKKLVISTTDNFVCFNSTAFYT